MMIPSASMCRNDTEACGAMVKTSPLIFDGHNDVLSKLASAGGLSEAGRFLTGLDGAIDLVKARSGGFGGGFFAIWVPSSMDLAAKMKKMVEPSYDLPLPDQIDAEDALPAALGQIAILLELERLGALQVVRSVADIRDCMAQGRMAAIFHIEGAEAIDTDLHALDVFYAAGLRSIGPVWSRPNIFGHGVPLKFPSGPDTGDGLTDHGLRLVRRCNALGIMLDLSHLTEKGFWDVARYSEAPLVATHSNAHAICPHARNLTDDQLRTIAESDGMVGLNFATAFLREDGQMVSDVPLTQVLRHIDHLIDILGEDRVGLGSDYDGAMVPVDVTNVSMLPRLREAMERHGYGEELIKKLCHENWLRVLEKTWGA